MMPTNGSTQRPGPRLRHAAADLPWTTAFAERVAGRSVRHGRLHQRASGEHALAAVKTPRLVVLAEQPACAARALLRQQDLRGQDHRYLRGDYTPSVVATARRRCELVQARGERPVKV